MIVGALTGLITPLDFDFTTLALSIILAFVIACLLSIKPPRP
jgi:hypothetical protein